MSDRVKIAMQDRDVEISWDAREVLLVELKTFESAAGIVQAFEAVGASQAVTLSLQQRDHLRTLIDEWERRVHDANVPDGALALRDAIANE